LNGEFIRQGKGILSLDNEYIYDG